MTFLPWGPVQQEMADAVAGEPVDIAGVVDQLVRVQGVLDRLPPMYAENPVSDFNKLYTVITERILDRHRAGTFAHPSFLNLLDVEFAKRYFEALRLWGEVSRATPKAWSVLFCRYDDHSLRSLPCAVAGVNAHINYDLPFAVVAAWERLGFSPLASPQHRDYLLINDVFAEAIPGLRRSYLQSWQLRIDRLNGPLDDIYQNLLVELTRDLAWDRAVHIWCLRHDPAALERLRISMDHDAALIGRILLSPLCRPLQ